MNRELEQRIAAVAADRESGASQILERVIAILRHAIAQHEDLQAVAVGLQKAQPSMAPVWNAARAALRGDLDRFAERVARTPKAIARFAMDLLETGAPPDRPIRIVTVSYSGTVAYVLEHLAERRSIEVACSEGQPALEGRRLAARLAAARIPVTFYLDAALGDALDGADAVVVGADAVAPAWFVNKTGTRMLAASAAIQGLPLYVVAGREKFAPPAFADELLVRDGPNSEVWADPPGYIRIRNPYFERIPLELAARLVTDVGLLSRTDVAELCNSVAG
jgi:translation initiation factor 2B subunit (eIF-2B alpha/beta/delta family)